MDRNDSPFDSASRNSIACHVVPSPAIDITAGYRQLADIQISRNRAPRCRTRENLIRPVDRRDIYFAVGIHDRAATFLNVGDPSSWHEFSFPSKDFVCNLFLVFFFLQKEEGVEENEKLFVIRLIVGVR